ncbi:MAG: hypothetical protein LBC72_04220 [Spirochaetaceae bacterium]|jgi:hypothetical protein|nr:hypothetical protein [Spirochaetaceae bacterium]
MKTSFFPRMFCLRRLGAGGVLVGVLCAVAISCGQDICGGSYALKAPPLPEIWAQTLGEPCWRLEWTDEWGAAQGAEAASLDGFAIAPLLTAANPVRAWPYWPDKGVRPGVFRAAGAILPLDIAGGTITLSWLGGVEAYFYQRLAALDSEKRLPRNFDWKRFRALFLEEKLDTAVRLNPWSVDWDAVAQKTAASGFSASRLKPAKTFGAISVPLPADGPWFGVSPFSAPEAWKAGEKVSLAYFEHTANYFCPEGWLRCAKGVWLFHPYIR